MTEVDDAVAVSGVADACPPEPALDAFPDAVVSVDAAGRVCRWNPAAHRLLGVPAREALGAALSHLVALEARDTTGRFPERQWARAQGRAVAVEVTRWRTGQEQHLCLRDARQRVAVETEAARGEAVLRRQARSDALTGLANRYELEERLLAALAPGSTAPVALVVVDLDGFKPINDSFGHAVGDEILTAVGRRLRAAVREKDTVARLGGDEFVVLAEAEVSRPSAVVDRIRAALTGPISTTAGALDVGASVGLALSQPDSDADDLLRRADKAMYRVKLARSR